jgi:hypothetical protein
MIKFYLKPTLFAFICLNCFSQKTSPQDSIILHKSFGLCYGASLIFYPNGINPIYGLYYAQSLYGNNIHQIGFKGQLSSIILPDLETKFLFSNSIQYKYFSKKRFMWAISIGLNYQLRKFEYDKYEFRQNDLVKSGGYTHQVGPIWGTSFSHKIIKRNAFSMAGFIDYSRVKLNKSYHSNLLDGYKSLVTIGTMIVK